MGQFEGNVESYMGRPIESFSKEELIVLLSDAVRENHRQVKEHHRRLDLLTKKDRGVRGGFLKFLYGG